MESRVRTPGFLCLVSQLTNVLTLTFPYCHGSSVYRSAQWDLKWYILPTHTENKLMVSKGETVGGGINRSLGLTDTHYYT